MDRFREHAPSLRPRADGSGSVRRGQLDPEGRTSPDLRVDADRATHARHQLARDVQPEPRPAHAGGLRRVKAVELLEDPLLLRDRDADPVVFNLDDDRLVWAVAQAHLDRPAVRRVLDRVLEQVGEHLAETVAVAGDLRQRRGGAETDAVAAGERVPRRLDHAGGELGQVAWVTGELELVLVELAGEQ